MKKLLIAALASLPLIASFPAMSLEPWHDYYRAKAHAQKAEKARAKAERAKAEKAEKGQQAKNAPETRTEETRR